MLRFWRLFHWFLGLIRSEVELFTRQVNAPIILSALFDFSLFLCQKSLQKRLKKTLREYGGVLGRRQTQISFFLDGENALIFTQFSLISTVFLWFWYQTIFPTTDQCTYCFERCILFCFPILLGIVTKIFEKNFTRIWGGRGKKTNSNSDFQMQHIAQAGLLFHWFRWLWRSQGVNF